MEVTNADRERAVGSLMAAVRSGALSVDEFEERMQRAYAADTPDELEMVLTLHRLPIAAAEPAPTPRRRALLSVLATLAVIALVVVGATLVVSRSHTVAGAKPNSVGRSSAPSAVPSSSPPAVPNKTLSKIVGPGIGAPRVVPATGFTSPLAAESAINRAAGSTARCRVVVPADQAWCVSSFDPAEGKVRSTVRPDGDYLEGNKAIVELVGTYCVGKHCVTLTRAKQVRPDLHRSFAQAWALAANQQNGSDAYMRIGGDWYLDPGVVVPAGANEPVPAGVCTRPPNALDAPAGTPSKVAGQSAASLAATVAYYAGNAVDSSTRYYRLDDVTPADGIDFLPATERIAAGEASHVTVGVLTGPQAYATATVYQFASPAEATTLVRLFWVVGCAQGTHVDAYPGAVAAYLTTTQPGSTSFFTDVVIAVGRYSIVCDIPGQLPASVTEPIVIQVVSTVESPNISRGVDIPGPSVGPVVS